jgi:hypothetical protein
MRHKPLFLLALAASLLLACQAFYRAAGLLTPTPLPPPTATQPPASTATLPPTDTPAPAESPIPTEDPAMLTAELQARLANRLNPPGDPNAPGIRDVVVLPAGPGADGRQRFIAHTVGERSYETEERHFVALFRWNAPGWAELGRVFLDEPDFLVIGSARPVVVDAAAPEYLWIEAQALVGAHGGCYYLFQSTGADLQRVAGGCNSSPGGSRLTDLNGDGRLEVVLDQANYYVFCYACGVVEYFAGVWAFDGGGWQEARLQSLPEGETGPAAQANQRAVTLAAAGLWQAAAAEISQAQAADPANPLIGWNAAFIRLHAAERNRLATESPYPLLAWVFAGEYGRALDSFRGLTTAEIFAADTPMIRGTAAEGWQATLRDYLVGSASGALQADPNLAAAYYLRAWAHYVMDPTNPQIILDLEKAVSLDPAEPLYSQALDFLRQR